METTPTAPHAATTLTVMTLAMCRAASLAALEAGSTPFLRKFAAMIDAAETAERRARTTPATDAWSSALGYYDAMSQEQATVGRFVTPAEATVVRMVGSMLHRAAESTRVGDVPVLAHLAQSLIGIEHGMWAEGRERLEQAATAK